MRNSPFHAVDRFAELEDRDVETLIAGGAPESMVLMPLTGFIAELRSMAKNPLAKDVIDFYAAESAAAIAGPQRTDSVHSRSRRGRLGPRLRHRAIGAAATLAMLLGATGMAWAADGAVPGDWNYGLDRALEVVGIGAGGAAERLEELQVLTPDQPEAPESPTSTVAADQPSDDQRAQNLASDVANSHRPAFVPELLRYLNTADHVDRAVVSAIARGGSVPVAVGNGPPADKGKPDNAGPPADKGKPDNAGPPADKGKPSD